MELTHIVDFYYLDALARHAKLEAIDHKWSKILDKVEELQAELIPRLADAMYSYLFLACMGEGRHAYRGLCKTHFAPELWLGSSTCRSSVYYKALEYSPKDCQPKLLQLFSYEWQGSYGGKNWANIVRALEYFHTKPNAFFVDHVVDLQHNCGTAFSKQEANTIISWSNRFARGDLNVFLSIKKNHNLLTYLYEGTRFPATSRVRKLLSEAGFLNAVASTITNCEGWDWKPVKWGDEVITLVHSISPWRDIRKNGNTFKPQEFYKTLAALQFPDYIYTKLVTPLVYEQIVAQVQDEFAKHIEEQKNIWCSDHDLKGFEIYEKAEAKTVKKILQVMKKEVMPSKAKSKATAKKAAKSKILVISSPL